MLQAYRFALDPSPAQARLLASHCGAARKAFNEGLAHVKRCLDQREAERTYGVPGEWLTEVPWTLPALRRWWNASKNVLAPWWAENSKEAYNSGLAALADGLRQWSASRSGKRRGARIGFPRFKSRRRSRVSCRFTTGAIRADDATHVVLPASAGSIRWSRPVPCWPQRARHRRERQACRQWPGGRTRSHPEDPAWPGRRRRNVNPAPAHAGQDRDRSSARRGCLTMSTHIRSRDGNGYSELTRTVTSPTPVMAGRSARKALIGNRLAPSMASSV